MMEPLEGAELCFPQLPNISCTKPMHPHTGLIFFYFQSLISLLTAVLNLLVIISISHFRQLHTSTNILLLSLAVSDFLVGLMVMPGEIMVKHNCWFLGDLMCVIYYLLLFTITCASIVCMVLISVDRYMAICHPLHYPNKVTLIRVKICVCLCWEYSVFVSILFLHDNIKQPGRYNSCYGECAINIAGDVDLVVSFIFPIIIIITLYFRIFLVAISQARAMRSHIASVTLQCSHTVTAKKSELKAARNLGVVVAMFVMCYCPFYGVSLTGGQLLLGSLTDAFMTFLVYSNSCMNPVIYAFLYPWFRNATRFIVTLQIMQPGSRDANIL